jgi:hypothetical protein
MIKWNKVTEDKKVDLLIAIIASIVTLISGLLVFFK